MASKGVGFFVDFGRNKVFALADDGEDVLIFESFGDLVERLRPTVIVVDSICSFLGNTVAEIAKTGITFLRLKNLRRLSEERKANGVRKNHENDAKMLREIYRRHPYMFQPISTAPEELEVRALTELWVGITRHKKMAKHARTTTEDQLVTEMHKKLTRYTKVLAKRIHEKAMALQLYRKAVEELGVKGPMLAYIICHDAIALTTLPKDRLAVRYCMTRRFWKRRPLRSRLLTLLAAAAVINGYPKYRKIYEEYRQKGKRHWSANLRVAMRMLRDLRQLSRQEHRQLNQRAGPPA